MNNNTKESFPDDNVVIVDDSAEIITSETTEENSDINFQNEHFESVMENSTNLRHRSYAGKLEPGSLNALSAHYESLDYDTCENHLMLEEERRQHNYSFIVWKDLSRWIIVLLIGVVTALIAFIIDISIEVFSDIKYKFLKKSVDRAVLEGRLYLPYLYWVGSNILIVSLGSVLVAYFEPVAGGSGIPQVKCYLNGVKVPRVVRIKTLVIKTIGVISSVVGGLAGGKEGPMIHSGAVVAAGISQGKSTTFNKDFKIFQSFREDHEKRDFVSAGAAAGVSAAFGAPIGGVLFSLEEGTSFWNQALTWRTFFGTAVATFTLNVALSAYHGHLGELSYPGLLNLGKLDPFPFQIYELPIFALFGAIGGILGAIWNHINYKLSVFRIRWIKLPWVKVIEACTVAAASATAGFLMMFLVDECRPLGNDPTKVPLQLYCNDGEYNVMAAVWFQTPEQSVRSLLHDPPGTHSTLTLAIFVSGYYLLSIWTFGLAVSSGIFIPNLLAGAAWGRMLANTLQLILPVGIVEPRKYALIGAAAQLGGVVRMTISLTVILLETTGQISDALPIIVTLIVAKWTGDYFNEGIYDIHIQLAGVPILPWEAPARTHTLYASTVMSHPAVCVRCEEKASTILNILHRHSFNGFPVVEHTVGETDGVAGRYKKLRGLILRSQLIVLLQNKMFDEYANTHWNNSEMDVNLFRDAYPRYPTVDQIALTDDEMNYTIDLRPFMNPTPYTMPHNTSLPRLFRLFRALGLRHLPIVNNDNEVIGMVTRKDIARYRVWRHRGEMGLEELLLSNEM